MMGWALGAVLFGAGFLVGAGWREWRWRRAADGWMKELEPVIREARNLNELVNRGRE